MILRESLFERCVPEIRAKYFPDVEYYRDDKDCMQATYALELFNNGCLTYAKLIKDLARYCKDSEDDIKEMVNPYLIFD